MNAALPKPFRFVRWFCLLSLVAITIMSIGSAWTLSHFLARSIVQRDATTAMDFVNSAVQAQGASRYFVERSINSPTRDLERFFALIARMPDVLRANAYASDGHILWSSNADLVGMRFDDNSDLERAFSGILDPGTKFYAEGDKEEHAFFLTPLTNYIEYYMPIWGENGKDVIGVVEVYRSTETLVAAIRNGQIIVWVTAVAGGLFLYAALILIVYQAGNTIRQQQVLLVESEKLAVIGEMTAAVAHGLRNPLATVRSSAELILSEDQWLDTRENAEQIVSESDRMANWINSFLCSVESNYSGRLKIPLDEIISECLDHFSVVLEEKNVALVLKIEKDLPALEANQVALEQAFNSIITNSMESMPKGGTLLVEAMADRKSGFIGVRVTDSGTGVPERKISSVFDPFVTNKKNGLGVGLPLARRIIERFGGSIGMASVEGQGTVVTMRLPVVA